MTGGAESCINLEKKVRVNIVNFSSGKKYIICDNNNGYSLSTVFVPGLFWIPGDQPGSKGERINISEYLPCVRYSATHFTFSNL